MEWYIRGVNRQDGRRTTIVVESDDGREAAGQARGRGLLVLSVSDRPFPINCHRRALLLIGGVVLVAGALAIASMRDQHRIHTAPSRPTIPAATGTNPTAEPRPNEPVTFSRGGTPDPSTDRESLYNAQRDPPYLSNKVSTHQTRSAAIAALAVQFDESPNWVEANMGSSNSLAEIHRNLVRAKLLTHVNYSLVETLKSAWRNEGWRYKSKAEQAQAMALMVLVVQTDIKEPVDQQATLDYIQRTIDSW